MANPHLFGQRLRSHTATVGRLGSVSNVRRDPLAISIRRHMQRHDLSVTEVAARAGLVRSQLSAWLSGTKGLRADSLVRVLDALKVLRRVRDEIER